MQYKQFMITNCMTGCPSVYSACAKYVYLQCLMVQHSFTYFSLNSKDSNGTIIVIEN